MKKRNRLLSSPNQNRIFRPARETPSKNRHILFLSFLALAGVFITSMVLARSEPSSGNESRTLQLPGTSTESQVIPLVPPSEDEADEAAPSSISEAISTETHSLTETVINPNISESESIERLHLQTPASAHQKETLETVTVTDENEDPSTLSPVASHFDTSSPNITWQEVEVKSGDNLSLIFPRVGLGASDVYRVAQTPDTKALLNLRPGQIIKFGLSEQKDSDRPRLEILQVQLSAIKTLEVKAVDNEFVAEVTERELVQSQQIVGGEIQNSLFVDGQKSGMSDRLIMELARIFGWDIDFALDLRQGDSFKVIFNENFLDGEKISDGEILAAEFINRGKVFRAVRFTDSDGKSEYFTPEGDSMRKAFTRTPVPISRISSRFNPNRLHPVLKTNRPHRGVDYAAPTGTPILATGDGNVSFIGNKGGYGRTVIISHGGRYTTLFAHMSRYQNGLKTGQRVKQGDVIGYVGMSGMATGPHLHYEFRVNGVHKDPLTVELPDAEGIPGQYRAQFTEVSRPLLASLQNLEVPTLAALKVE